MERNLAHAILSHEVRSPLCPSRPERPPLQETRASPPRFAETPSLASPPALFARSRQMRPFLFNRLHTLVHSQFRPAPFLCTDYTLFAKNIGGAVSDQLRIFDFQRNSNRITLFRLITLFHKQRGGGGNAIHFFFSVNSATFALKNPIPHPTQALAMHTAQAHSPSNYWSYVTVVLKSTRKASAENY